VDEENISQKYDMAEILDPYEIREAQKVQIQKIVFYSIELKPK
jgi:hypothetical protein